MTRHRYAVTALVALPLALALVAAAPAASESDADDLIRRANAAFEARDIAAADRLYALAEEITGDPGLVAFNRGTVLFRREQYREAETCYGRVLQDAECPPERAARASYNRGTCLLYFGGSSAVYLRAIAYLGRCHDSPAADPRLKANARDNLELAKALWKQAYDREKDAGREPENPNDHPPPDTLDSGKPEYGAGDRQHDPTDPGAADLTQAANRTMPHAGDTSGATGQTTQQGPTAGASPEHPRFPDSAEIRPQTPEATRRFLRDTAMRLQREQRVLDDSLYTSQLGVMDR